jgi:hydrogenase maturation protease
MSAKHILVLGIGNTLFTDEGFGVHVVEKLQERYDFADNVSVMDGGVLGLGLMGIISQADYLIVVDAVRNKGRPGDFHRLDAHAIPERMRAKNSLHQVDFIEALSVCRVLDKVPETVIFGVEPEDIDTLNVELTPTIKARVDGMIDMVLAELDRLGASYSRRGV